MISNTQQVVDQRKFALGHILAFGPTPKFGENWDYDSYKFHGRILTGQYAHYCYDWDGLPLDETCREFETCSCFSSQEWDEKKKLYEESGTL